jgi:5'-methylthioadenosine phosphorylase
MEVINAGQSGPESSVRSGEIVMALLHAAGTIRHAFGEFLERFDQSEGRFAVMEVLSQAGFDGVSQAEIAEQLRHSESNISSLIERLHRDGFVDRRWSDSDRRKRVLLLNASGHQLVARIRQAREAWAEAILCRIGTYERRELMHSLKALNQDARNRPENTVRQPFWMEGSSASGCGVLSPHFALEQMLSTLGLAGRHAESSQ